MKKRPNINRFLVYGFTKFYLNHFFVVGQKVKFLLIDALGHQCGIKHGFNHWPSTKTMSKSYKIKQD